ncbi:unnamed protein product [Bursaphelenchus xylophilus]|uniref:(pine wood nematode) hypothetical protein n=1 Tax=Bursaphelenchus xylophilus TaxID=6326 RepID=A0A1I7RTD9_BURXY|nr:unnamed protein product [Bursaphelenchus xylophilus]CAG9122488.1 unnamed protein product [Bursaphelenchus xylophilus]
MNIPSLTPTEFPVSYLISEVISYLKNQDKVQEELRNEWVRKIEKNGVGNLDENMKALSEKVFAQGNVETRLEHMGYRVGYSLAERLSKDLPRLPGELESVKFICKEFWTNVFGKQVDNLRTNHQGTYVIQDNKFPFLTSFSEGQQYLNEAILYLALPAGILRGALSNLGIETSVVGSSDALPIARFNVTVQQVEEEKNEVQPLL